MRNGNRLGPEGTFAAQFQRLFAAAFVAVACGNSGAGAPTNGSSAGNAGMNVGSAGKDTVAESGAAGQPDVPSAGGSGGASGSSSNGGTGESDAGKGSGGSDAGTSGTGGTQNVAGIGGSNAGTGGDNTGGTQSQAGMTGSFAGSGGSSGSTAGTRGDAAGMGGSMAGSGGSGVGGSAGMGTGGSTAGMGGDSGSSGTGDSAAGAGGGPGGGGGSPGGTGGTTAGAGGGPLCTVGSVCRAASGECDQPEYYDSDCNCPADLLKADGSACGSQTSNACDDPDTCQAGVCQPNHKSAGTFCGGKDVNNCRADECDGNGSCQPNQPAFGGSTCGSVSCTAGVVTGTGVCNGVNTGCVQGTFDCNGSCNSSGTACAYNNANVDTSDDVYNPLATDNDANSLYVAARNSSGTLKIVKYSKVDYTAKTTLLTDTNTSSNWVGAMIVAGSSLYFSENNGVGAGGIYKIDTTTANQALPPPMATYPTFGFAKNSSKVFWTNAQDAVNGGGTFHVYNATIGSSAVNMMSPNIANIGTDIEADDSGVYLWFLGASATNGTYSPGLYRYTITNATTLTYNTSIAPTLPDGNDEPRCACTVATMPGLTKNANGVVFANANYNLEGFPGVGSYSVIFKYSGSVTTITTASPIDSAMNFAADTNNVYFGNQMIPVNGGTQDYYTSNKLVINTLTADGSQVFFGSSGYWTTEPPFSGTPDVSRTALVRATP